MAKVQDNDWKTWSNRPVSRPEINNEPSKTIPEEDLDLAKAMAEANLTAMVRAKHEKVKFVDEKELPFYKRNNVSLADIIAYNQDIAEGAYMEDAKAKLKAKYEAKQASNENLKEVKEKNV